MGAGFFIMLVYLVASLFKGRRAGRNPWGALSMEWETASPPIPHNFETDPVYRPGPYDYDKISVSGDMYADSAERTAPAQRV
jgi:cytochrome c oxidase subunit 1